MIANVCSREAPKGWFGFCMQPVHNKGISGSQALRQATAPVAGHEPVTEGYLKISGWIRYPFCHRRPRRGRSLGTVLHTTYYC
ncbi:hypothetical protein PoB_001013700 [Plakobranchus ocellatus]|uniref:Uncharacterized protein n=1 Tax=Plakobranchus ocellatus TaxID=259542 RepID=A0AAV3YND8_9GAST|nr:hypothetical protein PoB_001013700 [Plakobranchus ocellatus]